MDTRLVRISTHDANEGSVSPSGSAFTISLGNVLSQVQANVVGYSIESVGFYNYARNVLENISDQLQVTQSAVTYTVTIPQAQYDILTLITALNAQLLAVGTTVVVDEFPALSGYVRFTGATPFSLAGESVGNTNRLGTIVGLARRTSSLPSLVFAAPNHVDIGGERVAFFHSDSLQFSKHSIDGEGLPVSFSCSFPINVPHGEYQVVYPNQYQRSVVSWGGPHEIREIRLRLRTIYGNLFDLQGTDWFVVLRFFLQ